MKKKYLFSALLIFIFHSLEGKRVIPFFLPRSQATDSARQLVGWAQKIHLFDMDKVYGAFGVTPEITCSFTPSDIISCLFPTDGKNCKRVRITGSAVPDRQNSDWLADQFALPPDYKSSVSFDPHIRNFLVDLSLFFGMDEWIDGLYLQLNGPIVYTSWKLNFFESVFQQGNLPFDAGYFSSSEVSRSQLYSTFSDFITGKQLARPLNGQELFLPLCHARWSPQRLTKTGFAALTIMLGKDKISEEDYHLGWKIILSIPYGNKPDSIYLFEPIVGNAHHWELGFGLTGHRTFWHSTDYEKDFSFYFDANVTHLFNTIECRTFDIKNAPASRYMLAEKLGTPVQNLFVQLPTGETQVPVSQFKRLYTPVANLTTFPIRSRFSAQLDISFMFNFTCDSLSFDLGYNFWYRSCEKIKLRPNRYVPFQDNTIWTLKGDSRVYGFAEDGAAIALSATQSQATLFTGTNALTMTPQLNSGIDNPHDARTVTGPLCTQACMAGDPAIQTSFEPIFLKTDDLDICGAESQGKSSSLFFHVDYTKRYRDDWLPYIGIGTKVEFAHNNHKKNKGCRDCALSQWALWIKGGLGFR